MWSVIFKVSVQVHRNSWHSKDKLNGAEVKSYVVVHLFFKTASAKAGRDKYEVVVVAVVQLPHRNLQYT